jgi:uncharacterized protein YgbK (DUF1537 family)
MRPIACGCILAAALAATQASGAPQEAGTEALPGAAQVSADIKSRFQKAAQQSARRAEQDRRMRAELARQAEAIHRAAAVVRGSPGLRDQKVLDWEVGQPLNYDDGAVIETRVYALTEDQVCMVSLRDVKTTSYWFFQEQSRRDTVECYPAGKK